MKKIYLYAALFALLLSSCEKNNCEEEKCSAQVICTAVLVTVNVAVNNSAGNAVTLDEAYTIRKSNGERINIQQNMDAGRYYVLDDSYQRHLVNRSEVFEFVGKIAGRTVVSELYTIGADCCHINKVSGKESIVAAD